MEPNREARIGERGEKEMEIERINGQRKSEEEVGVRWLALAPKTAWRDYTVPSRYPIILSDTVLQPPKLKSHWTGCSRGRNG